MKKAALALAYFAVIVTIIFLADRRESQFIFDWVRAVPGLDKLGHFLAIGGLAFVANYSLTVRTVKLWRKEFLLGSIIIGVLTVLEEFSQVFIRYRTFDFLDLACDFVGIWAFGKLAQKIIKREASPA